MPSLTVENYLKAILQLSTASGEEWISPGRLGTALQVTPGTVTNMLKTLSESGLARYKPYAGVSLTKAGRSLALRMIRRHRLLELFLVRTLDLTWDQVHEEAEHMEHAVSDTLIDRIDAFLQHPITDPHGDPIPAADGQMRTAAGRRSQPLADCRPATEAWVARVLNQQPEFLRFLTEAGLRLGTRLMVESNSPEAGVVVVRVGDHRITLGHLAAQHLLVEFPDSAVSAPGHPVAGESRTENSLFAEPPSKPGSETQDETSGRQESRKSAGTRSQRKSKPRTPRS